jgi:predicted transcriptional regulator
MLNQLAPRERQIVDMLYARGVSTVGDLCEALPVELSASAVRAMLARLEAKTALTRLLTETRAIRTNEPPAWIPSVMVRRLQKLPLEVEVA